MDAAPNLDPINDEELDQICSNVYPVLFRLGILLGVDIHDVEAVEDDPNQDPWSKCRKVIKRWMLNVAPERQRGELAKALIKVQHIRDANLIDPFGKAAAMTTSCTTEKDTAALSIEDLDMVAHELSGDWDKLATYLSISVNDIEQLRRKPISLYRKAYVCLYRKSITSGLDRMTLIAILRQTGKGRLAKQLS